MSAVSTLSPWSGDNVVSGPPDGRDHDVDPRAGAERRADRSSSRGARTLQTAASDHAGFTHVVATASAQADTRGGQGGEPRSRRGRGISRLVAAAGRDAVGDAGEGLDGVAEGPDVGVERVGQAQRRQHLRRRRDR